MKQIGPLQVLVVGFTDPKLDGSVLGELAKASETGVIRLVDVIGVYKDQNGEIAAAQATDLTEDEAMEYGAWIGALIGLGAGGVEGAELGAMAGAMVALDEYDYGLDEEALETIAEDIPVGGAAMLAVIEHSWAIGFRNAMRDSGGILIAQDFLSPETLLTIGALTGD